MGLRLELHEILKAIPGVREVYFQPPESIMLDYPCIVYSRSYINTQHANNRPYKLLDKYSLTVIDSDPDSQIPKEIFGLPACTYDRHYTADNLNHDVFTLYY